MPQASDIQSIEVLKMPQQPLFMDLGGSNGVVMVTTKKGRNGKLTVEMNSTYATQNTANRIDLLNADDFATYQNRIITNGGGIQSYIQGSRNTDWQDLIYRSGSKLIINFSGGSDKMNFMLLQLF
jgi:Mrp family chromosome partitioning ATPase